MIKKYNSESKFLILLFIINIIFCILYFSVFNFNFSWDTVGYAAIGKIYFGYNEPFWAIKYYYSPGFGLLLGLSGLFSLNTFFFYKVFVYLISFSYPFLIYFIVKRFDNLAAKISSVLSIILFSNTIYSTDIVPHFHVTFFFILSIFFLTKDNFRHSNNVQYLFWTFFFITCLFRGTYIFCVPLIFLYLLFNNYVKNFFLHDFKKYILNFSLIFLIIIGSLSALRAYQFSKNDIRENAVFFGINKGLGPRVIFQGIYTAGSFYLNKSGESSIFRPQNGEKSMEFYSIIENGLKKLDYETNPIKEVATNANEALEFLIKKPSHDMWYYLGWWLLGSEVRILHDQDKIIKATVLEAIKKNPDLINYFMFNLYNWFFGDFRMVHLGKTYCDIKIQSVEKCFPKSTFKIWPVPSKEDPMLQHLAKVIGEDSIENLKKSSNNIYNNEFKKRLSNYTQFIINFLLNHKYVLSIFSIIAIFCFINDKKKRNYLILNFAIICTLAFLTSIVWPPSIRYWLGSYIFLIINSSFLISFLIIKIKKLF